MSFDVIQGVLASDLATSGTLVVSYPSGRSKGNYSMSGGHKIVFGGNDQYTSPKDFTVSFGANASGATITWRASNTIESGRRYSVQFEHQGQNDGRPNDPANVEKMADARVYLIDLGSPVTADNDAMIKAATSTELPNAETVTYTPDTNGTSPTDGVASVVARDGVNYWELDVPRNVFVNTTHASSIVAMTVKVTGLDEYGQDMYEEISVAATGTNENDSGVKAFKWIRSIAFTAAGNAEANTCNVGFGDVLGLPVFLPATALVLLTLEDTTSQAGTLVAGSTAVPSATSADVRGTFDPNSACNGNIGLKLFALLADPAYKGGAQYAG